MMLSRLLHTTTSRRVAVVRPFSSHFLADRTDAREESSQVKSFSATTDAKGGVFGKMAVIGTGKMAQALIEPLVTTGIQPASDLFIFDAYHETMQHVAEKYQVQATDSIEQCTEGADLVLCAVKPQNLTAGFFEEVRKGMAEDAIFLSVIAGKPIETFQKQGMSKIVRSMPNTPAQVGEGALYY